MTAAVDPAPGANASAATSPPGTSLPATSLPGWLMYHAQSRPRAVALRVKELGRWREITWAEYAERVSSVGRALAQRGVGPGDRVAIVCDNRPEWIITDLAVQGIGAATVGVFVTSPAAEVAELLRRSRVKVAIVEDEEQLDKFLETRDTTGIECIAVIDTRGIRHLAPPAMSFEELEALGRPEAVAHRGDPLDGWRDRVASLPPDGVATVVFTPGTTGTPKGVLLTHANLVAAADAGVAALGLSPRDEIVSSLPLCEIAERALTVAQAIRAGATVNFGEGGESLVNDLREVQPTVLLGAPRVRERMRADIDADLRTADVVKRKAVAWSLASGRRSLDGGRRGRARGIGDFAVARPLRRRLGLAKVRLALSATAPCRAALVEWWWALGLPLREAYGLTETAGFVTIGTGYELRPGRAGVAVAGVEVRIADEGEVLVRGPVVFSGYLDDPAATTQARDAHGWLHTGDIGELDADGHLAIVDRIKDIVITSGGHRAAPRPIERHLEASPYVHTAIVVGDRRPCLGALLVIDATAVGDWAAGHDVPYTTPRSLAERPEVHDLLAGWVGEVNAALDELDRVECFALLGSQLSHDEGAVTATSKVRRGPAAERYRALVDAMYAELDSRRGGVR